MRILEVIHGYPPDYNAGSENYTETIVNNLVNKGHEVAIFCRVEEPKNPEFQLNEIYLNKNTKKYTINITTTKDRFTVPEVENALNRVIEIFLPEVAHIEHLNHLSLGIPHILANRNIPMVYTLHDFWLMCPRGQFIQNNSEGEAWKVCDGQENSKCATICYRTHHSGYEDPKQNLVYWTNWVSDRMRNTCESVKKIDRFIAPSKTVLNSFLEYYPDEKEKTQYLDYGFDLRRLQGRNRVKEDKFVFGYIGTHIPAKGVDYLIKAFGQLKGKPILRIWGRWRNEFTPAIVELGNQITKNTGNEIQWMGEFQTEKIIDQVFNKVDAIVVPSIWLENSPLVIHEAQGARVPVITANVGGMAEYVDNEVNGLLFEFRNIRSLAAHMQKFVDDPLLAVSLGRKGYRYSDTGEIPAIDKHVDSLIKIFRTIIKE
jgi:glycosyltransferase involved in cell wall biosynthesis